MSTVLPESAGLSERAAERRWLGRDLVWRLLQPLLLIVVASGVLGTYTAQRLTSHVFDRWLLDTAESLAQFVQFDDQDPKVDLPSAAETVLAYDDNDRISYSVVRQGRVLAGREDLPLQGRNEQRYGRHGRTFDAELGGRPVRIGVIDVGRDGAVPVTVVVAETVLKRQRIRTEVLAMLWPIGLLLIATIGTILLVVTRTLRPLQQLAARWNERTHMSLEPLDPAEVPRELAPFATALNDLLARIRAMLMRERQFASTAAHQLRTPLTGLQLALARASEAPDLDSTRGVLRDMGATVQRTARLVQQLLLLARLDPESRADVRLSDCDLLAQIEDVGALLSDAALAKDVALELHAPEAERPIVRGQPDLLAEALANLLDNAITYSPVGGCVEVRLLSHPLRVEVHDSGPGIPAEERAVVFERFVRGQGASAEGTGLGLAIVSDIAALHGAQVTLGDSPLGGLCVTLTFPPTAEAGSAPAPP